MRDWLVGISLAAFVGLVGWLALARSTRPEVSADDLHALGTLMTLLSGIFSAIWWHQSAELSNRLVRQECTHPAAQIEANVLNGAAATLTALALIAGVFSSLPWPSIEGWLAGGCFLALLAISGDDICAAALISARQRYHRRSLLGLCVLVIATGLFIRMHLMR